ncbi:MAG: hypothetical protein HYX41_07875 [Bdellovibrio sp.]|nr:hypothetical protein [Bdellovibrio sp.]
MIREQLVELKVPISKYEIVLGRLLNGNIVKPLLVGFAVQFEGESHYVIRLTMFPNNPYYLCKDRDSHSHYTAFAKVVRDPESTSVRFLNPVGSGYLTPDLKSHLEIWFPLLGTSVFMNLFSKS